MPLSGLISVGRDRSVAGVANADPICGVGGADQADHGITGLVVQFLEGRGLHHKPPFRGRGLNAAWLLGRDQKDDLAHTLCFGSSRGSTLTASIRIGVLPGIRGSVIERPPAGMAALTLVPAPKGGHPWQPET